MGRLHARLYRISGGRFLPRWFAGAPVMVLETVGRRSGHKRATPVLYLRAGDALIVLAANAGADRTPAWWLNLRDAGSGEVLIGRRRVRVRHGCWQAPNVTACGGLSSTCIRRRSTTPGSPLARCR